VIGNLNPRAYAPGFMLMSAPRTNPVATAPGTDLIAAAQTKSFDKA